MHGGTKSEIGGEERPNRRFVEKIVEAKVEEVKPKTKKKKLPESNAYGF